MITICLTYFKGLTLANLAASLYSVRMQDLSRVAEIVVVDNNTLDSEVAIRDVVDSFGFPVPVYLISSKHGDASKTHAWSTNVAVAEVKTRWVLFTRADYLLEFDACKILSEHMRENRFIVGGYYDVQVDVHRCEQTPWREDGPSVLQQFGREFDHVLIDSGVWMTTKEVFDRSSGLNGSMSAWGHAQTEFQYRLWKAGVEFVRVPRVVFYHTAHAYVAPRDHAVAEKQVQDLGLTLTEMWARYNGPDNPYRVSS